MSAHDALSDVQFVSHKELAGMYSADFDVPMTHALEAMRQHDNDMRRQPEDRHPAYKAGMTPGSHVAKLAADIAANGMHQPIEVRGGNVVTDGHHRALAAMRLRLERVPIRPSR